MNVDVDKNDRILNNIIKLKIDIVAKGNQGKIESALERRNKEKILPIRFKQYGDPDIRGYKLSKMSKTERREYENLNRSDIHSVLK